MIKKYTSKNITWIDIEEPNRREIKSLMNEYKINHLVADELLIPTFRPSVDFHKDFIYLILHFPVPNSTSQGGGNENIEIDFVIGKDFLITTRYSKFNPFQKTSKIFEIETILDNKKDWEHAGYLFCYIVQQLYEGLINELDYIENLQEEMEKGIFGGNEKQMVKEISIVSHDLLDFRQATAYHQEILDSLEIIGSKFFGKDFAYFLKDINNKYRKVSHILDNNIENLKELRGTNDSLLTTKQNETMKIFTILAFVTFPLSLFASIFGMNSVFTPIIGLKYDFWMIIGIMLLLTALMFLFFKYKKWF